MKNSVYGLMNWPDIEEIVYSECSKPHKLLGAHMCGQGMLVQIFRPDAVEVAVHVAGKRKAYICEKVDEAGYFSVLVPVKKLTAYTITVENVKGCKQQYMDPYAFETGLTAAQLKKLTTADETEAYRYYGAHAMTVNGVSGINFAVWAPNAIRVSIVGGFNNYDGRILQMAKDDESGIFQLFVPEMKECESYQYEVKFANGDIALKNDPYCRKCDSSPARNSVMYSEKAFTWQDDKWISSKKKNKAVEKPMSICELNPMEYAKNIDKAALADRIRKQGYTHVELMAAAEYSGKNCYETLSYYAVASGIGEPEDLKQLVNLFHQQGIGVIIDWNVAFMGLRQNGLSWFDGTGLYETSVLNLEKHPDWKVANFNMNSPQVRSFLLSNAMMWVREYHIDGLRVPELSSILYLDYGRNPGEWIPNLYGGNENLDAVAFFAQLRKLLDKENALLIAEDSSAWRQVTGEVADNALGFHYKWNDTWRNALLHFIKQDPLFRKGEYNRLTEPMLYHYSENFLSEFSHEALGEAPIEEQMPGASDTDKLANLRVLLGILYTYPGKKLLYENAFKVLPSEYIKAWNDFYKKHKALYELDYYTEGFSWGDITHPDETVLSFTRSAKAGEELLVIINFTPVLRENYSIGVGKAGKYTELFNTDNKEFGGSGYNNASVISSSEEMVNDWEQSISVTLPPLAVIVLQYAPYSEIEQEEIRIRKEAKRAKQEAEAVAKQAKLLEIHAKQEAEAAIEAEKKAKMAARAALEAKEEAEQKAVEAERASRQIDEQMKKRLEELKKMQ